MDLVIHLMICTVGIHMPGMGALEDELCLTYKLSPQYEMSQEEIDGKIIYMCEKAHETAVDHGGYVTKCEVIDLDFEIPSLSYNFSF